MLKWVRSLFRSKAVTAIESLFGGIDLHRFSGYGSYLKAGSQKIWATWKACDIVAQTVMDTPFQVQRKGGSDPVRVPGLDELLLVANRYETFPELIYRAVMHLKLTGNAYWYKASS